MEKYENFNQEKFCEEVEAHLNNSPQLRAKPAFEIRISLILLHF
jgi:hypothetical protein